MKQKHNKLKIGLSDYIKVNRKASRDEEIEVHRKPVGYHKIHISKKRYSRKKNKADQHEDLLYFLPC